jgi:hypothetical protein
MTEVLAAPRAVSELRVCRPTSENPLAQSETPQPAGSVSRRIGQGRAQPCHEPLSISFLAESTEQRLWAAKRDRTTSPAALADREAGRPPRGGDLPWGRGANHVHFVNEVRTFAPQGGAPWALTGAAGNFICGSSRQAGQPEAQGRDRLRRPAGRAIRAAARSASGLHPERIPPELEVRPIRRARRQAVEAGAPQARGAAVSP